MSKLIAITGGIGAGKSVVSNVLRSRGFAVYDSDAEAKRIMDCTGEIKQKIASEVCCAAICADGSIDRKALAEAVFCDGKRLEALNRIVHGAVRDDLEQWLHSQEGLAFVETAILYQSGLDKMVDEVWEVAAPEDIRIERVGKRSHLSPQQVKARMDAQQYTPDLPHPCVREIINDGQHSVLCQIEGCLAQAKGGIPGGKAAGHCN